MEIRAAGGTKVPLMLDWLMWLSIPKVNAEWEKPENKNKKRFSNDVSNVISKLLTTNCSSLIFLA